MRKRYRNIDPLIRALAYVSNTDALGCWNWTGGKTRKGYGCFQLATRTTTIAHRYIYEQLEGPIPDGLQLDHLCRNRSCCNPSHLEPVTLQENVARGLTGKLNHRNSVKTHCTNGHEYTEDSTYRRPDHPTWRGCKLCRRL